MYTEILSQLPKNILTILLMLGSFMTGAVVNPDPAFGGYDNLQPIKYEDPNYPDDIYMVLYPETADTGKFEVVQLVNLDPIRYENESGTYVEYPDKYVLRGDLGLDMESIKDNNSVISAQTGVRWVRA